MPNNDRSPQKPVLRKLTRRSVLGAAGALVAAPWIVRDAFASSGALNFMGWSGIDQKPVFDAFSAKTGIKLNFMAVPDNATMLASAKVALQTGQIDCMEPTLDQLQLYIDAAVVQPWNPARLELNGYLQDLVSGEVGKRSVLGGKRYFLPSIWGTEGLIFDTAQNPEAYGTASLADLFDPKNVGKVVLRPASGLTALGRVLDAQGKLPAPFIQSFSDDAAMTKIWDAVLAAAIADKANVGQFWNLDPDAQQGFRTKGCTLGLCWDLTARHLQADNLPFSYVAPKEGAFAWCQGYALMANARNVTQAEAWVRYIATAQGAAANAKAFSANPAVKGAAALVDPALAKFNADAFPGDAMSKLWWWPTMTDAFLKRRAEYDQKFLKA